MKKGGALTPQQRRVLALLAEGLSHEQIAEVMGVTRITVKKHIVRICEKLTRNEHLKDVIQSILLREP
jgi:DNA-binding NarL/FixJ family response regulator